MFKLTRSAVNVLGQRCVSSLQMMGYGAPKDVIKVVSSELGSIGDNDIVVKIAAAPIFAEDIKMLNGTSFVKSAPGSIAGTLGVGTVTRVGSKVGGLSVHDKVFVAGRGLWSSEVIVSADGVVKLISPMKTEELAVVPVLLSAWALLHNFKALKAGDVVIQAGGTSTIGIAVTQLAKLKGITVVNITEKNVEEVKVKAALAICGSSALTKPLQRALAPEGQLVLYTDAVEPLANITSVDVAVSAVIFKETSVYGFSLQSFLVSEPARAKAAVEEVCALLDSGKVSVAQKKYKVADLHKAIEDSSSSSLPVLSMI